MEDFVPYELAVKLEQKGFKQGYNIFGVRPIFSDETTIRFISDIGAYEKEYFGENIAAPTISQVLKWLREEKKISIEPTIHSSLKWVSGIYSFDDGLTDFTQYDTNIVDDTIYILYNSYELAALAGIEYVLDNNLI